MTYLSLTLLGIAILILWIMIILSRDKKEWIFAVAVSLIYCLFIKWGAIDEHTYKIVSEVNKDYYCVVNEDGRAYVIPNNDISIGVGDSFTMTDCEFNKKYPNVDVTDIKIN